MAQIEDRKSTQYSQRQSVRDELSAPKYLESAGDILIKKLAKKQTRTSTTLQEQLEIVQNFEKCVELNPEVERGITSLKEFQARIQTDERCDISSEITKTIQDVDELMKITGLTRHELELSLSEKPNSIKSQLYKFAISSKRQKFEINLENQLLEHPINKLKEIEEECFGHLKKGKVEGGVVENQKEREKRHKKRKHGKRKRKKQVNVDCAEKEQPGGVRLVEAPVRNEEDGMKGSSSLRPSLWDVKDMKRWSESKTIGCSPCTYYTIKDGRIVKLDMDPT